MRPPLQVARRPMAPQPQRFRRVKLIRSAVPPPIPDAPSLDTVLAALMASYAQRPHSPMRPPSQVARRPMTPQPQVRPPSPAASPPSSRAHQRFRRVKLIRSAVPPPIPDAPSLDTVLAALMASYAQRPHSPMRPPSQVARRPMTPQPQRRHHPHARTSGSAVGSSPGAAHTSDANAPSLDAVAAALVASFAQPLPVQGRQPSETAASNVRTSPSVSHAHQRSGAQPAAFLRGRYRITAPL
ncbi:hypothetical protein EIP86_002548 [Pleurotus ostreatoroseus]|nr:hypothetical protein EIP86_002548 [Pleurotus ostreatoroseus]